MRIPRAPWRVVEVHAFPGYRLEVKFTDGSTGEVDMSRLVMSDSAGIFAQLRLTIKAILDCTFVGERIKFGRRANFPRKNRGGRKRRVYT